jgi:probable rRNA maturation factor
MKEKAPIHFFKEKISFRLTNSAELQKWISLAVKHHKFKIEQINFIFCSDKKLLVLNKKFLKHNYFTDIITFDNSTEKKKIEADIFISVERVTANSKKFKTTFKDELHRVIIHGVLHLLGYSDKTKKDVEKMRGAENFWLGKR